MSLINQSESFLNPQILPVQCEYVLLSDSELNISEGTIMIHHK